MPINWPTFQKKVANFITNQKSTNLLETATFFGTEYQLAISTGTTLFGNTIIFPGDVNLLINAFKNGFEKQLNSNIDLGVIPYTIMAGGIVAFWSTVKFNPLPPAPPSVIPNPAFTVPPLQVCQLVSPGLPVPLNKSLQLAFKSGAAAPDSTIAGNLVSASLILAFTTHIATIGGIYNGITPVPAPIVVPWIGII